MKAVKRLQYGARPGLPSGVTGGYVGIRSQFARQHLQISRITGQSVPTEYQCSKGRIRDAAETLTANILEGTTAEQFAGRLGGAAVHRSGQLANAAITNKAVGVSQHGGLLSQGMLLGITALQFRPCK